MKKLNISEMEVVNGGLFDASKFVNGVCIGVGIWGFLGGPVGAVLGGGCIAWGIYTAV